ncbi:MAG: cytochrome c biogenesis protein CcsA [Candidatus Omnitrophica bacterium]|nr:cytochrome c biogenesis protein CcsA [Candidatus Omnitrophota bacterium]
MSACPVLTVGILLLVLLDTGYGIRDTAFAADSIEEIRHRPVLHNGRVKPFDSFAREAVAALTGAARWKGEDPVKTVLAIASEPARWQEVPLLSVPFVPLREPLGLGPAATHISYSELISRKFMRLLPPIVRKQQEDEKLTMLENETMDLYDRFVLFTSLMKREFGFLPPEAEVASWRLKLEVSTNRIAPFVIARWFYLAAALLLFRGISAAGMGVLGAGFLIHAAGIGVRVVLGGRPPVSNFYETMLWLPFVAVGLGLLFERIYRANFFGLASSLLAGFTLLLADHVPLDSSISPVVAVLRSNLWLTIHVLTIVASYGALALGVVLAHLYGGLLLARGKGDPRLLLLETFLYRAVQVGVVLLAAGIMLGGVWANASWGRYWGWDPKETWALITLLWFLALLHGRFAGWLKGAAFPLGAIGGFFLLLMTYYGVRFYLVGLHSYAGGHAKPLPLLLVAYILAELGFMFLVIYWRRKPFA